MVSVVHRDEGLVEYGGGILRSEGFLVKISDKICSLSRAHMSDCSRA